MNKTCWRTFDHLATHEPAEFQRVLLIWSAHCGTYKEAKAAKLKYDKTFKKKKRIKLKLKLSGVRHKVPAAKAKPAKSTLKVVVKTALKCDEHLLWLQWQTARDKYMQEKCGLLVSEQRKQLKDMLKRLMSGNKTHTKAFIKSRGLEALHVFCEAQCAARSTQKKG